MRHVQNDESLRVHGGQRFICLSRKNMRVCVTDRRENELWSVIRAALVLSMLSREAYTKFIDVLPHLSVYTSSNSTNFWTFDTWIFKKKGDEVLSILI